MCARCEAPSDCLLFSVLFSDPYGSVSRAACGFPDPSSGPLLGGPTGEAFSLHYRSLGGGASQFPSLPGQECPLPLQLLGPVWAEHQVHAVLKLK